MGITMAQTFHDLFVRALFKEPAAMPSMAPAVSFQGGECLHHLQLYRVHVSVQASEGDHDLAASDLFRSPDGVIPEIIYKRVE